MNNNVPFTHDLLRIAELSKLDLSDEKSDFNSDNPIANEILKTRYFFCT